MELARLILVSAVVMQVALWGWHFLERYGLSRLAAHPQWPRWIFAVWAGIGVTVTILLSRGLIHWGRTEGLTEPITRRLVTGTFLLCVIVFGLFRSKSATWMTDGRMPTYWKAKTVSLAIGIPVFILSVLRVPLHSDAFSVNVASTCAHLVDIPVFGYVLGILAAIQLVISAVACSVGLVVLKAF